MPHDKTPRKSPAPQANGVTPAEQAPVDEPDPDEVVRRFVEILFPGPSPIGERVLAAAERLKANRSKPRT